MKKRKNKRWEEKRGDITGGERRGSNHTGTKRKDGRRRSRDKKRNRTWQRTDIRISFILSRWSRHFFLVDSS